MGSPTHTFTHKKDFLTATILSNRNKKGAPSIGYHAFPKCLKMSLFGLKFNNIRRQTTTTKVTLPPLTVNNPSLFISSIRPFFPFPNLSLSLSLYPSLSIPFFLCLLVPLFLFSFLLVEKLSRISNCTIVSAFCDLWKLQRYIRSTEEVEKIWKA